MKKFIRRALNRAGYDIVKMSPTDEAPADESVSSGVSESDARIIAASSPFTMTSPERLMTLIDAVRFVSKSGLEGAIVECGVWKGGSMMAAALTLMDEGDAERELYLYDTFEGMSEPTAADMDFRNVPAETQLDETPFKEGVWCYSSEDEVLANLASTGYNRELIKFVKGKVEDTIPAVLPPPLAILRLDTDWYESTRHELEHLFPLLAVGGVMIIDDYGHWQGARKAVDEFLEANGHRYFLSRIDYTGRLLIKTSR